MNLQNYRITNLHQAFDTIDSLCSDMGSATKGSEIVGLVPLESLLEAGKWYSKKEMSVEEYIAVAIESLGLNSISPFNPNKRIIEWAIQED